MPTNDVQMVKVHKKGAFRHPLISFDIRNDRTNSRVRNYIMSAFLRGRINT